MNYVKLMADYSSDSVWDKDGIHMPLSTLPLPLWLKEMIRSWTLWYESSIDNDAFDYKLFTVHGYALAVKMKQNLPADWTVVYFDEWKSMGKFDAVECVEEITIPSEHDKLLAIKEKYEIKILES